MSRARAVLVLAALAVGACDAGPRAGELTFHLATPNGDDRAIQFTVTATSPATIAAVAAACAECQLFVNVANAAEVRGVLVGHIVAGPVVRVTVSDVRTASLYAARVNAVANRKFALRPPHAYALSLEP